MTDPEPRADRQLPHIPGCNVAFCPLLQMDWTYCHWSTAQCPASCRLCQVEVVKAEYDLRILHAAERCDRPATPQPSAPSGYSRRQA